MCFLPIDCMHPILESQNANHIKDDHVYYTMFCIWCQYVCVLNSVSALCVMPNSILTNNE